MPDEVQDNSQFQHLDLALQAWLDWVDQGRGGDWDAFFSQVGPELRPLLEPKLEVRPDDRSEPSGTPERTGTIRIIGELGRGGMGVAHVARTFPTPRRRDRQVAAPRWSSSSLAVDPHILRRRTT
jgi:hypothetical protein